MQLQYFWTYSHCGKEARFFRFKVFFRACYLQNEVGDPQSFYISDITISSSYNGKILRKKINVRKFPRKRP